MPKYGYKFVFCDYTEKCLALIKMEIPDDATIIRPVEEVDITRYNENGSVTVEIQHIPSTKLRCDKYKFIEVVDFYKFDYDVSFDVVSGPLYIWKIYPIEVNLENVRFKSIAYPRQFEYKLGGEYISELDTNIHAECSKGLHYFETIEDTEKWIADGHSYWLISKYQDFRMFVEINYIKRRNK